MHSINCKQLWTKIELTFEYKIKKVANFAVSKLAWWTFSGAWTLLTSGAIYSKLPTSVCNLGVVVNVDSLELKSKSSSLIGLALSLLTHNTFSGFTSRCATPRSWRKHNALGKITTTTYLYHLHLFFLRFSCFQVRGKLTLHNLTELVCSKGWGHRDPNSLNSNAFWVSQQFTKRYKLCKNPSANLLFWLVFQEVRLISRS